jgi:GTP-binding protein HflX
MREKQKALLIGVNINNRVDFKDSMEELNNLALACDIEVVGKLEQNLKAINTVSYIGSGKVEEVMSLINETNAEILIFNNELSPSQLRNIEKKLECRVMDRTTLILEIFAKRARTREAKLQVEVARLKYMLPRIIGSYESLERQRGGVGINNRGSGEKKLELDRRKIEQKIFELSKELDLLSNERQTQRKKRDKAELPTVALVGYTNTGKSTIMNALVELYNKFEDKKVLEKDMLFATLETSIRNIKLQDNKTFLLADTVGFVSDLPHDLVKAFRSTLEEVCEADLLIHVIDFSNSNYKQQIQVTLETLKQIGGENIPIIYAYNKIDLVDFYIPKNQGNSIYISAKKNIGLDSLINLISQKIFTQYAQCEMLIPYDKGYIISYLNENANIKSTVYKSNGTLLTLECKQVDYKRYQQFLNIK